jgi:hypothetical protein
MVVTVRKELCWYRREVGSAVVEVAVLVPVAMLVVLFAVQACIWAHASTLVQNAATEGDVSATLYGGSVSAGQRQAEEVLAGTAAHLVADPSVNVTSLPGGLVRVEVSGHAESIIPGIPLPVSAVRVGVIQKFRESG